MFLCRMNVSRNDRRQMRFGDQKVNFTQTIEFQLSAIKETNHNLMFTLGCVSPGSLLVLFTTL